MGTHQFWETGFRHLQRRRVSGEPPNDRHGLDHQHRSQFLEHNELVILGTEYAGEMKKGVFTVANYFAPKRGLLVDALLCHGR